MHTLLDITVQHVVILVAAVVGPVTTYALQRKHGRTLTEINVKVNGRLDAALARIEELESSAVGASAMLDDHDGSRSDRPGQS